MAYMMTVEMEQQEYDSLMKRAKAERDREVQVAEQKYRELTRSFQVTWEFANGNGRVAATQVAARGRGRPGAKGGPMALAREACRALSANYTAGKVLAYVVEHHPNARVNAKIISSALSKLVQAGEIRITKPRTGNTPAEYETVKADGST